jgi:hypothetical protein
VLLPQCGRNRRDDRHSPRWEHFERWGEIGPFDAYGETESPVRGFFPCLRALREALCTGRGDDGVAIRHAVKPPGRSFGRMGWRPKTVGGGAADPGRKVFGGLGHGCGVRASSRTQGAHTAWTRGGNAGVRPDLDRAGDSPRLPPRCSLSDREPPSGARVMRGAHERFGAGSVEHTDVTDTAGGSSVPPVPRQRGGLISASS